jgi:hypothetical protein
MGPFMNADVNSGPCQQARNPVSRCAKRATGPGGHNRQREALKKGRAMQRPDKRLVVTLVVAGALSLLVGLLFTEIVRAVPCQEERLACNIDQAIGAYAVMIYAVLGPVIFAVTLFIARNRAALVGAAIVLLSPPRRLLPHRLDRDLALCRLRRLRRLAEIPCNIRTAHACGSCPIAHPAGRGRA